MMKENPMHALCGAHCRTTGEPCKNYQMPNGRCRMHGGKSTGRPTNDGRYSKGAIAKRRELTELNREIRSLIRDFKS